MIYFIDSLLTESQLATHQMFDLKLSNVGDTKYGDKLDLSLFANFPYGAQEDHVNHIPIDVLPIYDCVYALSTV